MSDLKIFEFNQMAEILGIDQGKAKNWTNGRTPVVIEPSIRKATGIGSRNLYGLDDLYLMGVVKEFSRAGLAAKAIGKLLEVVKPELANLRRAESVTVWRLKPGGPFHLAQGRSRPEGVNLWHTVAFRSLLDGIDEAVEKASA